MNLAVIGSRTFLDYSLMERTLNKFNPKRIVSGGAVGTDSLAKQYAEEHDIEFEEFLPEYKKYGSPAALFKRNRQIIDASDCVIAFWDGTSTGTKDATDYATKCNKPVKIIKYKETENTTLNEFLEE
jgi:hypothetical protein